MRGCSLWRCLEANHAWRCPRPNHTCACILQSTHILQFLSISLPPISAICIFEQQSQRQYSATSWNRNSRHLPCISGSTDYLWSTYRTYFFLISVKGGCFCCGFWILIRFLLLLRRKGCPCLPRIRRRWTKERLACFRRLFRWLVWLGRDRWLCFRGFLWVRWRWRAVVGLGGSASGRDRWSFWLFCRWPRCWFLIGRRFRWSAAVHCSSPSCWYPLRTTDFFTIAACWPTWGRSSDASQTSWQRRRSPSHTGTRPYPPSRCSEPHKIWSWLWLQTCTVASSSRRSTDKYASRITPH